MRNLKSFKVFENETFKTKTGKTVTKEEILKLAEELQEDEYHRGVSWEDLIDEAKHMLGVEK